ncbi:PorT family protein [Fibrisoma montanum]|uniref:PorT family protein n=1 Tax=Fibrisoma montanum TaxID=2305895 RepID=A0A418MKE0_9BACT|nr:outer membrane beta-barrel protein [Fibrisoma montanum]RIV27892.1 PorT family protein [Fibrisoma montanum]
MKKVAGFLLILALLTGSTGWAQSIASQPKTYKPKFRTSKEADRRFKAILGNDYNERRKNDDDANSRAYSDEIKRRKRRRTAEQSSDETYPDYERPSHLIEMGIRFAPSLNTNTAEGNGTYAGFKDNGMGVRLSVGPTLDYFFFKDRYAFSSGLWYTIKRSGFQMPGSYGLIRWTPGAPGKESIYNLQYLQVPATVKMFANNIAPNIRLYVQTGGLLSFKLAEKALYEERNGLYQAESGGDRRQYSYGDVELLLGTGVQYKINSVNAFNIGVSYQRGLLDVARGGQLISKSRTVAVDLGFKF